jgi:Asp-tRNA(Asn)/Glu-tRNA(Gln) amidotransferase A subunit family amidase
LNAIVARCFDRARLEARDAEAAVLNSRATGLLHGIPVAIKDLTETAGLTTTFGSLRFRDHVPVRDENVVAALRAQGAIVIGKSNTPEFGIGGNTTNRLHGATRNPFAPQLTCGGSSGGAAVALATGMVPLATGTDSGGSLRNPAAFCGVVGFRPTPGLVASERRPQGWSPMGVHGPMARTVGDASLLLQAMAGYESCDPISYADPARFDRLHGVRLDELNVGFSTDLSFAPVAGSVAALFRRRVDSLSPLFLSCEEASLPMDKAEEVSWILRCLYLLTGHAQRLDACPEELEPQLRENLLAAQRLSAAQIAWGLAEQTRIYRAFNSALSRFSVLICPAASVPPFPVEQMHPETIDGRPLAHYAQWMAITYGITLVGHPALVIPCGVDDSGLPFGIQLVGHPHQDRELLAIGLALEQAMAADPSLARPVPPQPPRAPHRA